MSPFITFSVFRRFRFGCLVFVSAVGPLCVGWTVADAQESDVSDDGPDVVEELFPDPLPLLEVVDDQQGESGVTEAEPSLPEVPVAEGTSDVVLVSPEEAGLPVLGADAVEPALPAASGDGEGVDASLVGPSGGGNPYDLVLKDGRVLKGYQVHSWNKTTLTIFHSTGAANVSAHLLPPALVKAYGMDVELAAKDADSTKTKRTAEAMAALKAMDERKALRNMPVVTLEGTVAEVSSDGVVLQVEDPKGIAGKGYQRIGGMIYDKAGKPVSAYRGQIFGMVWVTDHPLQGVVVDGDRLRFQGRVSGRRQVEAKTFPSIRFEKAVP